MHAFVIPYGYRRVDFHLQTWMLVDFECVCDSVRSFVTQEAFFKNERSIAFHVFRASFLFSLLVDNDVDLFDWLLVLSI